MTSIFGVAFTADEQRFADYAQQKGWTLAKELVPAGEHDGETWDEFITLSIHKTRSLPDGDSVYAHVLSLSDFIVANDEWHWAAYLDFADKVYERAYGEAAS